MTVANEVTIASQIATQLAAMSISGMTITATSASIAEWALEELDIDNSKAIIYVVPAGQTVTRMVRNPAYKQVDYRFLVGVGAKVTDRTNSSINNLRLVNETALDLFFNNALTDRSEVLVEANVAEWPNQDELRNKNFFLAAFELTFRGFR